MNLTEYELNDNGKYMKTFTSTQKNHIIVTTSTMDYAFTLNILLSSLEHTNPDKIAVIYTINWSEELLTKFKHEYKNYYFKEILLNKYDKGDILKLKVKLPHSCLIWRGKLVRQ